MTFPTAFSKWKDILMYNNFKTNKQTVGGHRGMFGPGVVQHVATE
jgi:hypothetical protein